MKIEEIRTVGVVGAGSMGTGIIQVAAQSGFEVKAVDVDEATCARAAKGIAKILERLVEKGKITEDRRRRFSAGSASPPTWPPFRASPFSSRRSTRAST